MASPTGVIVLQIGSPAAPTPDAVRQYLREFLSDPYIIRMPKWLWQPILELILAFRAPQAAARYRQIWTPGGSPLTVQTDAITKSLQHELGENFCVQTALSYTHRSARRAFQKLRDQGCGRIIVLGLFPQATLSTSGRARAELQAVAGTASIELEFIEGFGTDPTYIEALAQHLSAHTSPEAFHLLSFHSLPQNFPEAEKYRQDCIASATALAARMRWTKWKISFQSKFGPGHWLGPATVEVIRDLALTQACPVEIITAGFTCDSIETLHELKIEGRKIWEEFSSQRFDVIPTAGPFDAIIKFWAQKIRQA